MPSRRNPSRRLILAVTATISSLFGAAACSSGSAVTTRISNNTSTSTSVVTMVVTGRPLRRRGGRARVGRSRRRGRSLLRVAMPDLSCADRAGLAAHWRHLAEMEHASIAAFEQLHRQLEYLGAPPALLGGCTQAAAQEADHARRCFDLASVYAGATIEPGRVLLPRLGRPTLAGIAAESLRDGVLNEGYAAWIATAQAERATDPSVVDTLRVIAGDEAEHAALSWRVVTWCAETGDASVRNALRATADAFSPIAAPAGPGAEHFGHGMGDVDPSSAGFRAVQAGVRARVDDLVGLSATMRR